jgi:hypothetical protein
MSSHWSDWSPQRLRQVFLSVTVGLAVTVGGFPAEAQAVEGRSVLETDWLFQAGGAPTLERVAQEIGWARAMAKRIAVTPGAPRFAPALAELESLEEQAALAASENAEELYLAVRRVKREIMLGDPVIDFDEILLVDNPYPTYPRRGKLWRQATVEWGHEARHRNGYMAASGGRLLVVEGLDPDSPIRNLLPDREGSFWRPDLSYDGTKVVFSFQPEGDLSFHLYEIRLDGSGLQQFTRGDYDDLDPVYLPDGHLMFSTSRTNTYVRCMPMTYAFALARCDADGKNIYITSRNSEPDYMPSVLNDGRIVYTRWEYTDKPLWRVQSLWSCNPDGTGVTSLWGNQSAWPDVLTEARSIPGSERIIFCAVGHHAWFDGCIGIIDPSAGLNYPEGLTKVTADIPWPETGDGPEEQVESDSYHESGEFFAYKSPFPLSEQVFLVSAREGGHLYGNQPDDSWHFRLYLMDVDGNRELLYRGEHNALYAAPVRSRLRPRVMPDRVAWPEVGSGEKPADGILFSNDVLEGVPEIPRDEVKYLRIIKMVPKTYSTWLKSVQHDGPSVGAFQAEAVKQVLGTVPVEADGSICFKLPAGDAVYFQLLDKDYRCIHNMRSFTGVMPGEVRGCRGCHEAGSNTPLTQVSGSSIASRKSPASITPPPWGDETIGFVRFAQPVFDQHCAECHQGEGEAVDQLNLTLRDSSLRFKGHITRLRTRPDETTPFMEPYLTLVGGVIPWGRARELNAYGVPDTLAGVLVVEGYSQWDPAGLKTLAPKSAFSYRSRIVECAISGEHHDVRVPPEDLRRLIAWVDTNGPYLGLEEIREMYDPVFPGIENMPVRSRVATAPMVERFNVRQDGDSEALAGPLKLWDPALLIADWPEGATVNIIQATYGAGDQAIDVTATLASSKINGPLIELETHDYNGAFTDPVPGTVKTLTIDYEVNSVRQRVTFVENAEILLRTPKPLRKGTKGP